MYCTGLVCTVSFDFSYLFYHVTPVYKDVEHRRTNLITARIYMSGDRVITLISLLCDAKWESYTIIMELSEI